MEDTVLPGDLDPGDLVTLPGVPGEVVVMRVLLGSGGFRVSVSEPGSLGAERLVVLTVSAPVLRHRAAREQLWPEGVPVAGGPVGPGGC